MNKKKVLFLDIDETLTTTASGAEFKQNAYDVKVIPGVQNALNYYATEGWLLIGVSNQGGCSAIDKSTGQTFTTVEEVILQKSYTLSLSPQLRCIYFCPDFKGYYCYRVSPYGDNFDTEYYDNSDKQVLLPFGHDALQVDDYKYVMPDEYNFRKPGYGMLTQACVDFAFDLSEEDIWLVGDRKEDRLCAEVAGINFCAASVWHDRFALGIFPSMDSPLYTFVGGM